ncbi:MAG: Proline iminopeptidase [Chlamydiia bacterium]|nr:Proline iminopeptidase [Chlamydiia bacterium]
MCFRIMLHLCRLSLNSLFYVLLGVFVSMSTYSNAEISFPHTCEERSFGNSLYPIEKPREEGFLKVSELHEIFYATYGNPDGIPVVVLHGGPGFGCSDKMTKFFDLNLWNVVMFDQRGASRSKPFALMEENTPQHSVGDIEKLRKHLGIEKWVVFGGSWGSTLAALYGQEHYKHCLGFILRGVWLARKPDYMHLFYGMGKVFPEAYAPVVDYIPKEERHDLLTAYHRRFFDPDPEVHLPAAKVFMKFDLTCATHLPDSEFIEEALKNDTMLLGVARTFCQYAMNGFFLKPNQILSNMRKIAHLPAIIVQGRWDAICPPFMAYELHQSWKNSKLWMIPDGGHSANDPTIATALVAAGDEFAEAIAR